MKKNTLYLVLFIALMVLAAMLFLMRKGGTFRSELKDFSVADTSAVTKVFMVDKANRSVLLERQGEIWMVNRRFEARKDGIETLLKTILRMQVKSPVPKTSFETVVRNLATQSTKVEVYMGKSKPARVFYVGGSTPDNLGTYMLMENSSVPFILYIPGFSGFLSTRFFLDEELWRNPLIFNYSYSDIVSVSLQMVHQPERSFVATNKGNNRFSLQALKPGKEWTDFDTLAVREYIGLFKRLAYESLLTGLSKDSRDSILASEPVHIITLTDRNKQVSMLKTFLRPPTGLLDNQGNPYPFDIEHMNAAFDGDTTIMVIQTAHFDPILVGIDFFRKE
jgi:hypothetical protein